MAAVAVLFCGLAGWRGGRADEEAKKAATPPKRGLKTLVTVEYEGQTLGAVCKDLAEKTGLKVGMKETVDPQVEVSLAVKEMKAKKVFEWIGKLTNYKVKFSPDGKTVEFSAR